MVIIACSSKAWLWLAITSSTRAILWVIRTIRQPYQSCVPSTMQVYEFAEVIVHGDQNPDFGHSPFQEQSVSGVGADVQGVVSLSLSHSVSLRPEQRSTRNLIRLPLTPGPVSLPL